jgi:hypothetical protein
MYQVKCILLHVFNKLRSPIFFICVFWISGLVTGLYAASNAPASVFPLVRSLLYHRTSIISLTLVIFFPIFVSCIAYWLDKSYCIFPIAFLKAFSYAYCTFNVVLAYGDAGWMMRWIILFSDSCFVVLLLWFWIRNFSKGSVSFKFNLLVCCVLSTIICLFDYFAIIPISVHLVNN